MSWGAVAGAGVSLVGGLLSSKKNKGANNAALRAQQQAFAANNANLQPYMDYGKNNLNTLNQLNSGNFSSFYESPDYQFTKGQSIGALDSSAASRGNLFGGGQSADLARLGAGLASQEYNNFYSKINNAAGMGLGAASALAGNNQNLANAQANNAYNNAANSTGLIGLGTGLASNLLSNYFGNSAGGSRNSSYNQTFNGSVNTGSGSAYNFGNNVGNFANWG